MYSNILITQYYLRGGYSLDEIISAGKVVSV